MGVCLSISQTDTLRAIYVTTNTVCAIWPLWGKKGVKKKKEKRRTRCHKKTFSRGRGWHEFLSPKDCNVPFVATRVTATAASSQRTLVTSAVAENEFQKSGSRFLKLKLGPIVEARRTTNQTRSFHEARPPSSTSAHYKFTFLAERFVSSVFPRSMHTAIARWRGLLIGKEEGPS